MSSHGSRLGIGTAQDHTRTSRQWSTCQDDKRPHNTHSENVSGPSSLSDWRAFLRETSLQGMKFVAPRPGPWSNWKWQVHKIIWLSIFLASLGSVLYFTVKAFDLYLAYETSTQVDVKIYGSVVFPAVTICNFNAWFYTRFAPEADDPTKKTSRLLCALADFDQNMNPADCFADASFSDLELSDPRSVREIYEQLGQQPEQLFLDLQPPAWESTCQWGASRCNASNFTRSLSEYGNCYTFNADRNNVLVSSTPGRGAGLRVTLNINQDEYLSRSGRGSTPVGLIVFIHPQDEPYLAHQGGFAVAPGTETYVSLRSKRVSMASTSWG